MDTKKIPWEKLRENVSCKYLARDEDKNFQIDIIKLDPNIKFDEHSHPDVEWVYILQGSMSDERGEYFAGDFIINKKGSKHIVSSGAEGCEILCCWCGKVLPT